VARPDWPRRGVRFTAESRQIADCLGRSALCQKLTLGSSSRRRGPVHAVAKPLVKARIDDNQQSEVLSMKSFTTVAML